MVIADYLQALNDDALLAKLNALVQQTRRIESELIAHMAETDKRRLYLRKGCSSMFTYCTEVLHLSEGSAYMRIATARAVRRHPVLLAMLADGRLHVSAVAKLSPHLTDENCDALLARAVHLSKRQIEELVVELAPKPAIPSSIRKLPSRRVESKVKSPDELRPGAVGTSCDPSKRVAKSCAPDSSSPAPIEPLGPSRYRVQFTASRTLNEKLQKLMALMSTSMPEGDLADFIEVAVSEKLERLEARRYGKTTPPRKTLGDIDVEPKGRYIPTPIRRLVRDRDRDRCTFTGDDGKRCSETRSLEFHHDLPFARGGEHSPENIRLLCKAHNLYMAERDYGKDVMSRYRSSGDYARDAGAVYGVHAVS